MNCSTQVRPRGSATTRQAILTAARDQFAEHSYQDVSLRAIARTAGVDVALIARYFGSKEDLFASALDSCEMATDLFTGPRETFGIRVAEELVFESKEGTKLQGARIMLNSLGSTKAAEIVHQSAESRFMEPFAAWLGGDDALVRTRVLAGVIMGMSVSRELSSGFGPDDAGAMRLCDRLATILQAIVDETD
ncbi:TetR/AcrR family transcriptional regulator [Brevundimonas aveniformis]|uniref:TetR/AcrR family transcriptional regulator n=1 Tax=Brevundimonas aveniformis TaxID=370977 RepID=UPI0024901C5D|nr:TetR/AcrR family transcriptional regulator [Brevundimonas aveniformis]